MTIEHFNKKHKNFLEFKVNEFEREIEVNYIHKEKKYLMIYSQFPKIRVKYDFYSRFRSEFNDFVEVIKENYTQHGVEAVIEFFI